MSDAVGGGRYPRYPAYRSSGVEWLGEVPEGWEVRRLKFVSREPIRNGIGEAGAYDEREWPRYVRITDIAGPRTLRDDTFKSLPPGLAGSARFEVGDLLLAAVGATYGKSYLHTTDIGAVCYAGYLVRFPPGPGVESGFAGYWTESSTYWCEVQSRVVQATIQNFSAAKYRELSLPLPPLAEQRAIAAFLDRETARIDTLAEKKERLLELLDEKRTALISRAVTKGLDPDVPMKDSGVEWLGEVPEGWEVVQAKRILESVTSGSRGWSEFFSETGPLFLQSRNLDGVGGVDLSDVERVDPPKGAEGRRTLVGPGDLLMCITGALTGNSSRAPDDLPEAYVSQHVALLRVPEANADSQFLLLVLRSLPIQRQITILQYGGTKQGLGLEDIRNLTVPLPPLPEQRAIAAFLDRETARTDALKAKVQRAIDLLKEYRTALISAAVTGKIDVRREAPDHAA